MAVTVYAPVRRSHPAARPTLGHGSGPRLTDTRPLVATPNPERARLSRTSPARTIDSVRDQPMTCHVVLYRPLAARRQRCPGAP